MATLGRGRPRERAARTHVMHTGDDAPSASAASRNALTGACPMCSQQPCGASATLISSACVPATHALVLELFQPPDVTQHREEILAGRVLPHHRATLLQIVFGQEEEALNGRGRQGSIAGHCCAVRRRGLDDGAEWWSQWRVWFREGRRERWACSGGRVAVGV